MAAQDPYLHAGLTPASDVELYSSSASGPTTYIVSVAVTATPTATAARTAALSRSAGVTASATAEMAFETTIPRRRSGRATVVLPPRRTFLVYAAVVAVGRPAITVSVDYFGRRISEDDLLLVGAF